MADKSIFVKSSYDVLEIYYLERDREKLKPVIQNLSYYLLAVINSFYEWEKDKNTVEI